MFVKVIGKNGSIYYLLTICKRVEAGTGKGKNKDTDFISFFIPTALAHLLRDNDVPFVYKTKNIVGK